MPAPVTIEPVKSSSTPHAANRVEACVDGRIAWFESDLALGCRAEPFLSAFLLPAMTAGRDLDCSEPVDAAWMNHMTTLQDLFHRWWGHPKIRINAPLGTTAPPPVANTAVLFSGGVDSFHTLLRHPDRIDAMLFIEGLDIPIGDKAYLEFIGDELRQIAKATGTQLHRVATNLREHPLFSSVDYIRTHGGALAACAQLLGDHVGRLIINSSSVSDYDIPFGTHWDSDPLWSCSWLRIEHWGNHLWRSDKLFDIMHEPIVSRHLRVCYHRLPVGQLNCGSCEKCVRTMLLLHQRGSLEAFPSLKPPHGLAQAIDRVRRTKHASIPVYIRFRNLERDPQIRHAIGKLILRSGGPLSRLRRLLHKYRWRLVEAWQRHSTCKNH